MKDLGKSVTVSKGSKGVWKGGVCEGVAGRSKEKLGDVWKLLVVVRTDFFFFKYTFFLSDKKCISVVVLVLNFSIISIFRIVK